MVDNITARFNELYEATSSSTLAFIAAKCSDMADMNDIFQETYMEIYRIMLKKGADYIENDEAFAIKIAKNKISKQMSLFTRFKSEVSLSDFTEADEREVYDNSFTEESIDDSICTNELMDEIESFLKTKPQDVQKIFFLRFSMEYSLDKIAQLMSVSEQQVKNKLYRTIREIRKLYQGKEEAS